MHTALGDVLSVIAGLDDMKIWRGLEPYVEERKDSSEEVKCVAE